MASVSPSRSEVAGGAARLPTDGGLLGRLTIRSRVILLCAALLVVLVATNAYLSTAVRNRRCRGWASTNTTRSSAKRTYSTYVH